MTPPATPAPTSRPAPDASRRSDRSRRAILDAALALIGEVGYRKLTVEAIAARAGVGKQTIYRWWDSKAAVLLDAAVDLYARSAGDEEALAFPDTGDLAADLKTVLRATVDEFTDPRTEAPGRALTIAGADDPVLGARFAAELLEPSMARYEARLRRAIEVGEIASDTDPRLTTEALVGAVTHRWLLRTAPLTHAWAEALVDQTLRGILPARP
ncbi:TetR/AcrR family transcriptional regulator [Streptomyces sp. BI20]|uniref:TetR/AcrR family transcriptional regulator n=1 Tax=Streptomyces sp. BI20 TaxID=3403460 RepID=UPI003C7812D0